MQHRRRRRDDRRGHRGGFAYVVACPLVVACAEPDDPREFGDLIVSDDRSVWTAVSGDDDDPFVDRRPDAIECGVAGWLIEPDGSGTEVDTGRCNYLTLRQPTRLELRRGDRLRVVFFHFDLTSATPAEGYAAVALGDEVVWSYTTPIPSPAGFFEDEVEVERRLEIGTPLYFHVDNHGQNTWVLGGVELLP